MTRIILHVPYTYFPDPCGGTEVYVRALAQRLGALGHESAIAAPGAETAAYELGGLQVFRFGVDPRQGRALVYGGPDEIAAAGFAAIVAQVKPAIVHLHARTAAVSERLIDIAHAAGARVVFTYHTPTASCLRGDMMLFGETPCDGRVEVRRCTACALAGLAAPRPLAWAAASLPGALKRLAPGDATARPWQALGVPALMAEAMATGLRFLGKVDAVVAVAHWVEQVLARNGVPAGKITLSRQGVDLRARAPAASAARPAGGPLRIGYFGRIDRTKGPDLLAAAIGARPGLQVRLDVHGIDQSGGASAAGACLARAAAADGRVRLLPSLPASEVVAAMAGYDLIAVPSRWQETGPLVVLEAFAAGTPVLGARLGGVAELVRDGVDGVLVAPGDAAAWAAAIEALAADRPRLEALRRGVAPPRTMDAAARDMAALYERLRAPAGR